MIIRGSYRPNDNITISIDLWFMIMRIHNNNYRQNSIDFCSNTYYDGYLFPAYQGLRRDCDVMHKYQFY